MEDGILPENDQHFNKRNETATKAIEIMESPVFWHSLAQYGIPYYS